MGDLGGHEEIAGPIVTILWLLTLTVTIPALSTLPLPATVASPGRPVSLPVVPLTMSNDTIRSLPSVSVKLGAVNFATGATSLSLTVSV